MNLKLSSVWIKFLTFHFLASQVFSYCFLWSSVQKVWLQYQFFYGINFLWKTKVEKWKRKKRVVEQKERESCVWEGRVSIRSGNRWRHRLRRRKVGAPAQKSHTNHRHHQLHRDIRSTRRQTPVNCYLQIQPKIVNSPFSPTSMSTILIKDPFKLRQFIYFNRKNAKKSSTKSQISSSEAVDQNPFHKSSRPNYPTVKHTSKSILKNLIYF